MAASQMKLQSSPAAALVMGAGALAIVGLADCTAIQMLKGDVDLRRTALWSALTLTPMMAAAAYVSHRPQASSELAYQLPRLAGWSCLLLLMLIVFDVLAFPADEPADWLNRARSKLPGAVAFVALGLRASWLRARSSDRSHEPAIDTLPDADADAIAGARIIRAAGNYVDVRAVGGRSRLIRLPIGKVAAMPEAQGLVRLHRSLLARASAIEAWQNDRSGIVAAIMDDGTKIPVGRKYRRTAYQLRKSCRSSRDS